MTILLTRKWPAEVERILVERHAALLNADDMPMNAAALTAAACRHEVICPTVSDRLTADVLGSPHRIVRLLCNYGAGTDHIDLDACRRLGVIVTNTPDVLTDATAELAVMLMLMVVRRASEGERELRRGAWGGWRPTHMVGGQLSGRTLGLIGFGRIGQATARKALGLGMHIAYHGRRPADLVIEQALEARYVPDLATLLGSVDVVSLHVPGGPATERMIDAAALARMRPGSFLINTARGSVIDEPALIDALRSGQIAGAGLDVFVGEPHVAASLLAAPNLVALPHLGSATSQSRDAMGLRVIANLEAWLGGWELPDRVA